MIDLFASGKLQKLKIHAFAHSDYGASGGPIGEGWTAFINPDEYTLNYQVELIDRNAPGTTATPANFSRVQARDLTLKFYLDGTGANGEKIDVHSKINSFFQTVGFNGDIHRPNYLLISWGTFIFQCSLRSASTQYKMFTSNGLPLRAVITATFTENINDEKRAAIEALSSPDLTHVRTVQEGDTLPLMAFRIYNDHRYYLEVARVNNLSDFRNLKAGQKIFFPPFDNKVKQKN